MQCDNLGKYKMDSSRVKTATWHCNQLLVNSSSRLSHDTVTTIQVSRPGSLATTPAGLLLSFLRVHNNRAMAAWLGTNSV
jgi:hypothetical protein